MKFKIDTKLYDAANLDDITLGDIVVFNSHAAAIGVDATWQDIQRIAIEIDGLTRAEAAKHPEMLLMTAATIWLTRRRNGEDISFGDAIDFPLSQFDVIDEPQDHQPKKASKAKKAKQVKGSQPDGDVAPGQQPEG